MSVLSFLAVTILAETLHQSESADLCANVVCWPGQYCDKNSGNCYLECARPQIINGYPRPRRPLQVGELLKIHCLPGYYLPTKSTVTCQKDGTYGNQIIPECESCEKPCGLNSEPICGSDGKVYDNRCLFENAQCWNRQLIAMPSAEDSLCSELCENVVCEPGQYCDKNSGYCYNGDSGKYVKGDLNTVCPEGSVINDRFDCVKAADELGVLGFSSTESNDKYLPSGCYDEGGWVYYNTHTEGNAKNSVAPICLRIPRKCVKFCGDDSNPALNICGSDGINYGNRCMFDNAQCKNPALNVANKGPCSEKYNVESKNSNSCSSNYKKITEDECENAAQWLFGQVGVSWSKTDIYPGGCYVLAGKKEVYFNRRKGNPSEYAQLICTLERNYCEDNGNCHKNAMCTLTPGSRACHCKPGYFGNGFECKGTGPDEKDTIDEA